jgi:hypothetical protein
MTVLFSGSSVMRIMTDSIEIGSDSFCSLLHRVRQSCYLLYFPVFDCNPVFGAHLALRSVVSCQTTIQYMERALKQPYCLLNYRQHDIYVRAFDVYVHLHSFRFCYSRQDTPTLTR